MRQTTGWSIHSLTQNNANIKQTDHEGRTCLSYAKAALSLATARLSTGAGALSTSTTIVEPNSMQPYSFDTTTSLVELLNGLGCTDPSPLTASGTLPRRRDTLGPSFEKLPSSVIWMRSCSIDSDVSICGEKVIRNWNHFNWFKYALDLYVVCFSTFYDVVFVIQKCVHDRMMIEQKNRQFILRQTFYM